MPFQPITAASAGSLVPVAHATRGWISEVRWSPNGRALSVAASAGVALYSLDDNGLTLRGELTGHGGHVKSVASSADVIASASADTTVRLWNLRDGGSSTVLTGHTNAVNSVALHGTLLASAGADQTIRLTDITTGRLVRVFAGHTDEITSVVFASHDRLISSSWDKTARVWDIESGETLFILYHEDWVREVACSAAYIATASKDMSVRLWKPILGELIGSVFAHDSGADTVSFSPDGSLLATGGRDNLVKIWRVSDLQLITELAAHDKPVLSVAFSPGGSLLASASGDNTLRIWGIPL